jgi:hypothetical protein
MANGNGYFLFNADFVFLLSRTRLLPDYMSKSAGIFTYAKHKLLYPSREHLSSFRFFRIRVAHSFSFLCGVSCLFFLRSVLCAQCFLCMSLNCPFLIVPSVFSNIYLYVMFSFMSYFPSCYAFLYVMVPSWSWSYGSWIHNYLCN